MNTDALPETIQFNIAGWDAMGTLFRSLSGARVIVTVDTEAPDVYAIEAPRECIHLLPESWATGIVENYI